MMVVVVRSAHCTFGSHRWQLEGNDVATQLKFALRSNSVVVMPPPKWENFLLHGLLKPWVHFVPVGAPAEVPAVLAWMREVCIYITSGTGGDRSMPTVHEGYSQLSVNND